MGIVAKKNILKIRIFYKIFCHKLLLLPHPYMVPGGQGYPLGTPDHPLTEKETRLV